MKKNLLIFVAIAAMLISCTKRIDRVISSKNDSLIMSAYLKPDFDTIGCRKLKLIADSTALETFSWAGSANFHGISYEDREKDARVYNYLELAISIIKKDYGLEALVDNLVEVVGYSYFGRALDPGYYAQWSRNVQKIEKLVPDSIFKKVKDRIIAKHEDPMFASLYLSAEKVTEGCIAKNFPEFESLVYACKDSLNRERILPCISDEVIMHSEVNEIISDEKRLQLARKANFDYAEFYLLKTDEERRDLFCELFRELCSAQIIEKAEEYYEWNNKEIIGYLKKLTTEELTESFPGEFVNEHVGARYHFEKKEWKFHFSYLKYSLMIIESVKNKEDFELAANFFIFNTCGGLENKMFEVLTNAKSKFL